MTMNPANQSQPHRRARIYPVQHQPLTRQARVLRPFIAAERGLERFVNWLGSLALFQLLEYAGRLTVLAAVIFYFIEAPERRKQAHYQAWQLINSAQGQISSGGRIEALQDLNDDRVNLAGLAAPKAHLMGINLANAWLPRANLQAATLQRALFKEALLWDADLSEADLSEADLSEADLQGADLVNADLSEANLNGANLNGANLSEANLHGAKLNGANLSEANLQRTQFHNDRLLYGGDVGADLSEANLHGAELQGANLRNANLQNANLVNVDLRDANLQNANLTGTNLTGTNLQNANLYRADLTGVKLEANYLPGLDPREIRELLIDQIKAAKNWEHATYDDDLRIQLGLPPATDQTTQP